MTLDDLEAVFTQAIGRSRLANREDLPYEAHRRAGIRSLVGALRDEFKCWIDADKMFNEILASDGGERRLTPQEQDIFHSALRRSVEAAGDGKAASTSDVVEQRTPDAPAADVCEWTGMRGEGRITSTCMADGITSWMWVAFNGDVRSNERCPNCGKPISCGGREAASDE